MKPTNPNKTTKRQKPTPPSPAPIQLWGCPRAFTVILVSHSACLAGLDQGVSDAGGVAPVTVSGSNTTSGQQVVGQVEDQRTQLWEFSVCLRNGTGRQRVAW